MSSKLVDTVEQWDETLRFDKKEQKVLQSMTRKELGKRFGLDDNESGMLWYVIQEDEDIDYCAYGIPEENSEVFLEQVQESIHQSFDGPWTSYDRIVIRTYLADVAWATSQVVRDRAKG